MSYPTSDRLDRTSDGRSTWRRDLAVTSAAAVLVSLSFVVGRLSAGHDTASAPLPRAAIVTPVPVPVPSELAVARAQDAMRAGVRIQPK